MMQNQNKTWDQQLREVGERIEEDLKRLVTFLNDEVVPDVRRNGSSALRTAAVELQRLAEQIDDRRRGSVSRSSEPRR